MRAALALALSIALPGMSGCLAGQGEAQREVDGEGFEVLADIDWEVPSGEQRFYCVRKTLDEDLYIGAFEALAPVGTHHTVLTAGEPSGPDGFRECGSFEHNFEQFIFESSSGANRFELPEGIGAYVAAGKQINLNVHVLNASDRTLVGTSGARIKQRSSSEVDNTATSVYVGRLSLDIPPGESSAVASCAIAKDVTAFGVLPHMHSRGTHMKVVAKSSFDGDQIILDEPFNFDTTKAYYAIGEEVALKQGDTIEAQCSYYNETSETIHWGIDSYTAEMCFAAVYVYPAEGISSSCAL